MTTSAAQYSGCADIRSDLREVANNVAIAARLSLLIFIARQALATLPSGPSWDEASHGLDLAARLAAGEPVDPSALEDALLCDDVGLLIYGQTAPAGPQADAWTAVTGVLGYTAWQGFRRRGEHPGSIVENFNSEDALDYVVDQLAQVAALDWQAVARAAAYTREVGSKAAEGWGAPLPVEELS